MQGYLFAMDSSSRSQPSVARSSGRTLSEMIEGASSVLKYPKIRYTSPEGVRLCFYRAGSRSRYCGQVMITDGRPYGQSRWYGRVEGSTFHASPGLGVEVLEAIESFLKDPEGLAQECGRLSGVCCYCAKRLTDPRSVSVGYGPICAGHYGLPWGADDV
jgi:hypothetical protein